MESFGVWTACFMQESRSDSSIDFLAAQNGRQEINEGLSPSAAARFRVSLNSEYSKA
jgi:hypothetical protein